MAKRSAAERAQQSTERAKLVARLEAEAQRYYFLWCNPVAYRQHWQSEWAKNIADMREERLARLKRREELLAWLIRYETWREANNRPIAYVGVAA